MGRVGGPRGQAGTRQEPEDSETSRGPSRARPRRDGGTARVGRDPGDGGFWNPGFMGSGRSTKGVVPRQRVCAGRRRVSGGAARTAPAPHPLPGGVSCAHPATVHTSVQAEVSVWGSAFIGWLVSKGGSRRGVVSPQSAGPSPVRPWRLHNFPALSWGRPRSRGPQASWSSSKPWLLRWSSHNQSPCPPAGCRGGSPPSPPPPVSRLQPHSPELLTQVSIRVCGSQRFTPVWLLPVGAPPTPPPSTLTHGDRGLSSQHHFPSPPGSQLFCPGWKGGLCPGPEPRVPGEPLGGPSAPVVTGEAPHSPPLEEHGSWPQQHLPGCFLEVSESSEPKTSF